MEDHFLYKLRRKQLQVNKNVFKFKKNVEIKKDVGVFLNSRKQLEKLLKRILRLQNNILSILKINNEFKGIQHNTIISIINTLDFLNNLLNTKEENEDSFLFANFFLNKEYYLETIIFFAERKLFYVIKKMRKKNIAWDYISVYLKKRNILTLETNIEWTPSLLLFFYKKMILKNNIKRIKRG